MILNKKIRKVLSKFNLYVCIFWSHEPYPKASKYVSKGYSNQFEDNTYRFKIIYLDKNHKKYIPEYLLIKQEYLRAIKNKVIFDKVEEELKHLLYEKNT